MLSSVSRSFTSHATRWSSIRCFSDVSSRFEAAQVKLNTLTEDPGNAAKLKIYGLFKQVLCNIYLSSTAKTFMLYIITVKARFNGTLGEGIKPGKSRNTVKRGIFYINFKVYKCINLAYWGKIEASNSRDTIN